MSTCTLSNMHPLPPPSKMKNHSPQIRGDIQKAFSQTSDYFPREDMCCTKVMLLGRTFQSAWQEILYKNYNIIVII